MIILLWLWIMWVGGLGKHIDDVLSASQCLSIKWNDSSFHFQYSFLLICWDKRKAGVYRACQPQCQCIHVSPLSCDLRCVIVLWVSPQENQVEASWPLFNFILFLSYKLIPWSAQMEGEGYGHSAFDEGVASSHWKDHVWWGPLWQSSWKFMPQENFRHLPF